MEPWTTPVTEDIAMNAEIGGYQPDGDERGNEPVATPEAEDGAAGGAG